MCDIHCHIHDQICWTSTAFVAGMAQATVALMTFAKQSIIWYEYATRPYIGSAFVSLSIAASSIGVTARLEPVDCFNDKPADHTVDRSIYFQSQNVFHRVQTPMLLKARVNRDRSSLLNPPEFWLLPCQKPQT